MKKLLFLIALVGCSRGTPKADSDSVRVIPPDTTVVQPGGRDTAPTKVQLAKPKKH